MKRLLARLLLGCLVLAALVAAGARVVPVPVDDEGLAIAVLPAAAAGAR